jgi:hypothetical protein
MSDYSGHEEPLPEWDDAAFLFCAATISAVITCLILMYA